LAPRDLTLLIALYHIPIAIMTMVGGTVGDRLTHAWVFTTGIMLTAVALPLCALAPSYAGLLAARIVQGIGAGLVFGTSPALITLGVSARYRARGLGLLNLAAGLALAVAPAVAGVAIDLAGWRSVFWFRVPISLGLIPLALSCRSTHSTSPPIPLPAPSPLIPPLSVTLLVSDLANFLANSAFIVLYVLGPLFLSDALGVSATRSGLLFMLVPLGTAVGGLVSGLFIGRVSPWLLTLFGLGLETAGLSLLSGTSAAGSESRTAFAFGLAGLGIGAFQVPNMAIVMTRVPSRSQGFGGGMISTMRTLGIVGGAIVSPRLFESRLALHWGLLDASGPTARSASVAAAFADVLWDATAVAVLALGLASILAIRRRRRDVAGR
jgi:MFS family permease